jgi:glucan 1,3-beta-glucosidase
MLRKALLSVLAAFLAVSSAAPSAETRRALSFDYDKNKVRGVNLGGWLLLEPWITPSFFERVNDDSVVDEYTLCRKLGSQCLPTLKAHWNSFITQDDFNTIARAGLNHVRIPIGYWAVAPEAGDPYVQGQIEFMDKAIGWARSAGLKVMIDLHGSVGSQNGFDNSGRRGDINWQRDDPDAKKTLNAIRILAQRYTKFTDVVTSIQALNEPANWGLDMGKVKQFYYDTWGTVRDSNGDTLVVIHDAFLDFKDYWNGFMNYQSGIWHVALDTHQYQIFDNAQVARKPWEHVSAACDIGRRLRGTDKWTIVGEWTGAQTDCAQWLNGKGRGARYDGTFPGSSYQGSCDGKYKGTVAGLSSDDKKNLRSYIEAQLDAYEQRSGWIFWTWKAESAPEWHMKDLLAGGLFPQPLWNRQYPNQCSY